MRSARSKEIGGAKGTAYSIPFRMVEYVKCFRAGLDGSAISTGIVSIRVAGTNEVTVEWIRRVIQRVASKVKGLIFNTE
jgi:hypothetical protein